MTKKQEENEKDKLFKTINNVLTQTGAFAAGIQKITSSIQDKIDEVKRDAQRKVIFNGLFAVGALLTVYGCAQVVMSHYGYELYTNLSLGIILVLGAVFYKALNSDN